MEDQEKLLKLAQAIKAVKDDLKAVKAKTGEVEKSPGPKGDKGDKGDTGPQGSPGLPGKDGKDGKDGADGKEGPQGVSVVDAEIAADNSLVLKLSNGSEIDAGPILFGGDTNVLIQQASGSQSGTGGGITQETDPVFVASPAYTITGTDKTNWNTAYGWGNHATQGYLKTYTETDPVFTASPAGSITSTQVTNWNSAFSWGNHASAGYLTTTAASTTYQTKLVSGTSIKTINGTSLLGSGDITITGGGAETDPVFTASAAFGVTTTKISNWDTAFGWGNHASAGYLTTSTAATTYQPLDGDLTAIAGLAGTTGLLRKTAANTWSLDTATYLTSAAIGTTVQGYDADLASWAGVAPSSKQDTLVSGTNIKTINGSSILGSGNLTISGGGGFTPIIATTTATQASTATALANLTQLVGALDANATYKLDCFVTFQSAATTTGLNLGFLGPTGSTCRVEIVVPITSTAAATQLRTTFPNAATAANTGNVLGTGVTAINSNHTAKMRGIISTGATAGNFQVQFASEVAGSAVTIQIGSILVLERIA